MHTAYKGILSAPLLSLIILSMIAPSVTVAGPQDKKHAVTPPSGSTASEPDDSVTNAYTFSRPSQSTPRPGPAWKTIGGTVTRIKGDVYTVEDYDGNQVHLFVNRDTKHLRGQKKVGDRVRVEITRDGFANSIQ
ncbi:hypothetical protein [Nitrospira sp. BLG_1]|uniref:hypothetical protein n=1 Tax=Nitrospira sp. BLG_1 TaxID=3395883 RepID=UPI0039BD697D